MKYSHTRAEMARAVRGVRELSHLRGRVFECLKSVEHYTASTGGFYTQYETHFNPKETISRLAIMHDIKCAACESLAGNPRFTGKCDDTFDYYFNNACRLTAKDLSSADYKENFRSANWRVIVKGYASRTESLCKKCRRDFCAFSYRKYPETKPIKFPHWWTNSEKEKILYMKKHEERLLYFQVSAVEWINGKFKKAAA